MSRWRLFLVLTVAALACASAVLTGRPVAAIEAAAGGAVFYVWLDTLRRAGYARAAVAAVGMLIAINACVLLVWTAGSGAIWYFVALQLLVSGATQLGQPENFRGPILAGCALALLATLPGPGPWIAVAAGFAILFVPGVPRSGAQLAGFYAVVLFPSAAAIATFAIAGDAAVFAGDLVPRIDAPHGWAWHRTFGGELAAPAAVLGATGVAAHPALALGIARARGGAFPRASVAVFLSVLAGGAVATAFGDLHEPLTMLGALAPCAIPALAGLPPYPHRQRVAIAAVAAGAAFSWLVAAAMPPPEAGELRNLLLAMTGGTAGTR